MVWWVKKWALSGIDRPGDIVVAVYGSPHRYMTGVILFLHDTIVVVTVAWGKGLSCFWFFCSADLTGAGTVPTPFSFTNVRQRPSLSGRGDGEIMNR